ncbi:hypothetical protein SAMN05660489_04870 [Pseudomonas sp. LAMO17WK12:I10]|uniref:contractile injection system tape measure protein n=1 Tax=unclassified Pseudomonas TaxID=196821 RepID=UPI000BCD0B7A|nr:MULTISPECIES: contractile injection system tape measure protein [unclassified Pseudomonas]PXX59078.1 hypothetical protein H160_04807 [Pseudomonas sp. LAMO17WK12:I9]SNY48393.1 hypothetical protein SAMN05660489_04870 [Pseudomonas sp. LAMO17WK12:I10]
MIAVYSTSAHRLDRLRICLGMPQCHADRLSDKCSSLFDRRLRTLISDVLDRVHQKYPALQVTETLILDLGELPLVDFEKTFCQRLEELLLLRLLSYGGRAGPPTVETVVSKTRSDNMEQFSHYLNHGYWPTAEHRPNTNALDIWLLEELVKQPQRGLPILASHCLHFHNLWRLYRSLQPATLTRLCLYLVDLQSITEPVTPGALRLCALRYFQLHPQCTVPMLRQDEPAFTPDGDEQMLVILFSDYDATPPALTTRLQTLWQKSSVRGVLKRHLTANTYKRLQSRLNPVGNSKRDNSSNSNTVNCHRAVDLTPISVSNGGITLLWPLLSGLFEQLGLMEKSKFIHHQAQVDAVCWLDELIWADGKYDEWRMPLNKLLCGLPLDAPLEWTQPDTHAVEVMQRWLSALPQRLPAWKHFGGADIRQLYLQRSAWLVPGHEDFTLYIEPQVYDVLLADWPWPTGMLMLPWLIKPLIIHWSAPPVE